MLRTQNMAHYVIDVKVMAFHVGDIFKSFPLSVRYVKK